MRIDSSLRRPRSPSCPLVRPRLRARGFSLLEILVVLAIIGLLAALAIAHIDRIHTNAQIAATDLFVRQSIKTSLFTYRMSMGDYPSTAEGLPALVVRPATSPGRWNGPYTTDGKLPLDPWGEPYQYAYPGKHNKTGYDVWSKGPDKLDGTADDIGNWDESPPAGPVAVR